MTIEFKSLGPVFAAAWCAIFALSPAMYAQLPPQPVEVSPVIEKEVATGQSFVGTVRPSRVAVIGSAVAGRVVEFPLNKGNRVKNGQVVAQLLTETIELQIKAAEAELEYRRQLLVELRNGSRPEEIAQAQAKMLGAQAQMQYATARKQRTESLFSRGRTVTEEERDEAVASAIAAEQAYLEAKAAHDLALAGPRQERIAQAEAQCSIQESLLAQLRDQLKKHTLISRFDGYVTAEHTEIGAWVQQGDPVVEVVALDEVEIEASVVEEHAAYVQTGGIVRVEVPALKEHVFTGEVVEVVPQADLRARTFPVIVKLANVVESEDPLIKGGMLARVTLPTGPRTKATLVPKDALVLGGPSPMVFVVDDTNSDSPSKVAPVPVALGVADGALIQVTGALQAGQKVVVRGNERLRPGQEIVVTGELAPELTAGRTIGEAVAGR